jgi:hypothetical protein
MQQQQRDMQDVIKQLQEELKQQRLRDQDKETQLTMVRDDICKEKQARQSLQDYIEEMEAALLPVDLPVDVQEDEPNTKVRISDIDGLKMLPVDSHVNLMMQPSPSHVQYSVPFAQADVKQNFQSNPVSMGSVPKMHQAWHPGMMTPVQSVPEAQVQFQPAQDQFQLVQSQFQPAQDQFQPVQSQFQPAQFQFQNAEKSKAFPTVGVPVMPQGLRPLQVPETPFSMPMAFQPQPQDRPFTNLQAKPREPPLFRGELNEDLAAWASLLNDYCYLVGFTPSQSVAYAATLLQGNARTWWDGYLVANRGIRPRTLEELLQALRQRFLSPMFESSARIQLWNLAQRKDERVHAFAARFQNLLQRLPRYDAQDMQERFIRALHPSLRMPVAQREPEGLQETIRLAEHLELLTVSYMGRATGSSFADQGQPSSSRGRGRGRGQAQNPNQQGRGFRGQGRGRGRGRGQGQGRAGNVSNVECYRCGEKGHYASECSMKFVQSNRGQFAPGRGNQRGGFRGQGRGRAGRGRARMNAVSSCEWEPVQQQAPPSHQAAPAGDKQQGNA